MDNRHQLNSANEDEEGRSGSRSLFTVLMEHKKWWIMPPLILIILLLLFALFTSDQSFIAFVYAFF